MVLQRLSSLSCAFMECMMLAVMLASLLEWVRNAHGCYCPPHSLPAWYLTHLLPFTFSLPDILSIASFPPHLETQCEKSSNVTAVGSLQSQSQLPGQPCLTAHKRALRQSKPWFYCDFCLSRRTTRRGRSAEGVRITPTSIGLYRILLCIAGSRRRASCWGGGEYCHDRLMDSWCRSAQAQGVGRCGGGRTNRAEWCRQIVGLSSPFERTRWWYV